jgi:hypothetical protein
MQNQMEFNYYIQLVRLFYESDTVDSNKLKELCHDKYPPIVKIGLTRVSFFYKDNFDIIPQNIHDKIVVSEKKQNVPIHSEEILAIYPNKLLLKITPNMLLCLIVHKDNVDFVISQFVKNVEIEQAIKIKINFKCVEAYKSSILSHTYEYLIKMYNENEFENYFFVVGLQRIFSIKTLSFTSQTKVSFFGGKREFHESQIMSLFREFQEEFSGFNKDALYVKEIFKNINKRYFRYNQVTDIVFSVLD